MQNIGFIDIETGPGAAELPEELRPHYLKRFGPFNEGITPEEHYLQNAGLSSEFGRIISATLGMLTQGRFYVKTAINFSEIAILAAFDEMIADNPKRDPIKTLAGHNIFEFDGPFLMRRHLIAGMAVPKILNHMNTKTWEVPFFDTMAMWGGTAWKYRVSLDLACTLTGINSPKQEIKATDVSRLFYSISPSSPADEVKAVFGQIAAYNQGDVIAAARLFARLKGYDQIRDSQIQIIVS